MPRRAATFTQADFARAIRAAKSLGMTVRVLPDGTMEFVNEPSPAPDVTPERPVAARREFRL